VIDACNVTKEFKTSAGPVRALDDLNLTVQSGEFVIVHGASGSGKTTLLQTLGGMQRPSSGSVEFQSQNIYGLTAGRRNGYRQRHVGFIFQKLFLVPYLSAFDNIRLALVVGRYGGSHRQRIHDLVERFGLVDRLHHRPAEMSVGEQQRIAAARAVAAEPDLILADEPTGNLDRANSDVFAEFLQEENRQGRTIVLVTHSDHLLDLGNRRVKLASGRIVENN